jgi:hypothetical protein
MHFLSFARKDRGIVINADLRFISGFILEQFSAENKAIKEELQEVIVRSLVAWIAEHRETETLEFIDKAIFKDDERAIGP